MKEVNLKSIAPAALFAILRSGVPVELLDVRTPPEHAREHVPGTKLVPLNEFGVESFLEQHSRGTPVYVFCQAGGRARQAIERLESAGCHDCILVDGGTQAWIDAGFPVNRGTVEVLPLMRQVQIVVGAFSAAGAALALLMSPWFALVPLLIGGGLLFAGLTGTCGMALLLARMPWNRRQAESIDCCTPENL